MYNVDSWAGVCDDYWGFQEADPALARRTATNMLRPKRSGQVGKKRTRREETTQAKKETAQIDGKTKLIAPFPTLSVQISYIPFVKNLAEERTWF